MAKNKIPAGEKPAANKATRAKLADTITRVSVKSLVAFSAKRGSLARSFTPAPSGQEGVEGHLRVTDNRPATYQTEIPLSLTVDSLLIRGRADGYNSDSHCLEEIKTFYGEFQKIPDNQRQLHWAQAKIYAWIFCQQQKCARIQIALVYFQLKEQREYRLEETWTLEDLTRDCHELIRTYVLWQEKINQRHNLLIPWLTTVVFPFSHMHPSQRQMAEAVYLSALNERVLLAEAPTGTGKTLASLFPLLKALPRSEINKIFYLTAKNTGKQLALASLELIASDRESPLRVVELTAQEKSCLAPDKRCAGDSCPYANNFYDKLPAARDAAYQVPLLTKTALATLATEFEICPFYLGVEMCRWVDVVVADMNYYFDGNPLLLSLTQELQWKPYLLVDECHNLIERGRLMYSAALNRGRLLAAKKAAPSPIKKTLGRINKQWLAVLKPFQASTHSSAPPPEMCHLKEIPPTFLQALGDFIQQYQEFLQHNPEHPVQKTCVQEFFFNALALQGRLAEINEDFAIHIQGLNTRAEELTLDNLVPAQLLAKRLAFAQGACFFSATLHPQPFYQSMLGLPENTLNLTVDSPFDSKQLQVNIAHNLSTRYRHRSASIAKIAEIIKAQLQQEPGNALIFFSSYAYLQQVEDYLRGFLSGLPVNLLVQARQMNEAARGEFINQFSRHNNIVGLAVLGGIFSEGIDLPGDALKGVFIATLGLPQINPVNECRRQYLQEKFQQGYNFVYLFPGLQKVIQAAGRVIRKPEDTGYLWLLDERFGYREIQQLLPGWWHCDRKHNQSK